MTPIPAGIRHSATGAQPGLDAVPLGPYALDQEAGVGALKAKAKYAATPRKTKATR
jgi:hypothetical protein